MPAPPPPPVIEAFGGGGFRIGDRRHEGSVLILGGEVRAWPVRSLPTLEPHDLYLVSRLGPLEVEVLLLGVGPVMAIAPKPVREAMHTCSVGLDVMSTPEACRMYNYLAGEGRRVAAALIAV